jgi:hypothetical protein
MFAAEFGPSTPAVFARLNKRQSRFKVRGFQSIKRDDRIRIVSVIGFLPFGSTRKTCHVKPPSRSLERLLLQ